MPSFTQRIHSDLPGRAAANRTPARKQIADCPCAGCSPNRVDWCGLAKADGSRTTKLPSTVQTARARRVICHPKEWRDSIIVVCSGWAASSITLEDGRRQILSISLPGDMICTTSLFGETAGRAVLALTDVIYRKIHRSDAKAALLENPDLFEMFARNCVEEKEQTDRLLIDLGCRRADERVARLILYLNERLGNVGFKPRNSIYFPLRQRQIADIAGLTNVHISKILNSFRRAGVIEIANRSLSILNADELRRIASWP